MEDSFLLLPAPVILLTVVSCAIALLILYARWDYGLLEKLGIPVVPPHFLFGSTFECRFKPIGYRDVDWMRKYGPVFGVYEGREPQIYVCDQEILRLIMIKDSNYFDAKGPVDFGDHFLNQMPDYLPRDSWRIVRSFTSPAFSSAKLRIMNYPMKESLIQFVNDLKHRVQNADGGILKKCDFDGFLFTAFIFCNTFHFINSPLLFSGLTDLALRSLFSIQDKSDRFPKLLKELANPTGLQYPNLIAIAKTFPILFNFIPPTLLSPRPGKEFLVVMNNLISSRKSPNSPPDVVDICIEQIKKLDTPEYKKANITREMILMQAFNFFFSGQDETALVISAMIYHILNSSDQTIQDKLNSEVDSLWADENDDAVLPREKLLQAEYLQACIYEALRLYTFYDAERVCTKDWHCEKYNFKVPKGMTVMAPLWAVNRNQEYYTNPDEFVPERFLDGNKEQLASFGFGPRHCTGKPLAMEVLRVVCAYLFKHFRFHLREDSALTFHPGGPWVFISHEPIYFDISLR